MRLFKRKSKPKFTKISTLAQAKGQIKEFILDTQMPDGHQVAQMFGYPPVSDEVAEKEEEESDRRLDTVAHLFPLLYSYAGMVSEVISKRLAVSGELQSKGLTPMQKEALLAIQDATRELLEDALSQALVGSVSQLVELELLKVVNHRKG